MNQILSTGDSKNKKQLNIKSIIKFFGIFLLIFGLCIIAIAAYTIFKKVNGKAKNQKPEIQIEKNLEDKLINIKILDDNGISKILYYLNNQETVLEGNNEKEKDIQINLENGENNFKIKVTDIDGESKEFEEVYQVDAGINIDFSLQGSKVKIDLESKKNISFITYRWNEEEETKQEINDTKYTIEIDAPTEDGEYILTVNAIDENNNSIEGTKKVIIDKEPTIDIAVIDKEFVIKAEDDKQLIKAELTVNGEKLEEIKLNDKVWEYKIPLESGENKLIVKVYNLNNVSKQRKVKYTSSLD